MATTVCGLLHIWYLYIDHDSEVSGIVVQFNSAWNVSLTVQKVTHDFSRKDGEAIAAGSRAILP